MKRLLKKSCTPLIIASCVFSTSFNIYGPHSVAAATNAASETEVRDAASAYLVSSIDAMDDGGYDAYLNTFINTDTPPDASGPEGEGTRPITYYKFWGLDDTDYYSDSTSEHYKNRAFCSDLLYMEYPEYWYAAGNDFCSNLYYHYSEDDNISEYTAYWEEFALEALKESEDQVKTFVESGGILAVLEEALGYLPGPSYHLELEAANDPVLIYNLKKGEKHVASIVIWRNLGILKIRNEDRTVTVERKDDYGRIMLFHEWDRVDFSTLESVGSYVKANKMETLLEPVLGETVTWHKQESYKTEYHDYLRLVGETGKRNVALYIPITPEYNENWIFFFESFKGTKQAGNAYGIQERVMNTVALLPYYHTVSAGEDLSAIAAAYTGDPANAAGLASYKTNQGLSGGQVQAGDRVEIPLGMIFKKTHHQ